ncbi:MAG: Calx-beta domain-containing protein, partial [Cyanobacteria bacterium J06632_3]
IDVTILDEPAPLPVVSFSTTSGTLSEEDGPALVLSFSVDGVIPPEGITVNLEGDMAEILQQFLAPDGDGAVQTRVSDDGVNVFYRFDTSFGPGAGLTGGILEVFSLEDGDADEGLSDPAAAGTGFLSNFSFILTEANATITLPVSDDIVQEEDKTFTYTLADGDGYTVDATQNSGTFTVTDGVVPATSPTVGVTVSETNLIEDEQTRTTITFTTEGDIPAEGLLVQLKGLPRAIAEFDVNGTNNTEPRTPEGELVVGNPVVTGGNIAGTDEVAGSVFFRITEATASIDVAVFDDDVAEGTENFSFSLVDGEDYEVDAANSGFDITIEDGVAIPGEVIDGTDSDDRLFGTDGDDTINALEGDDTVFGRAGNDTIDGGTESDRLFGGEGNDTISGGNEADRLAGNEGDDVLLGGNGNDRLFAGTGSDILDGGSGDDRLFGGEERDILIGGLGSDFLAGEDGNDVLMGVTGRDILVGGAGADWFVFGVGDGGSGVPGNQGNDLIRDFEVGLDKIGLVDGELTFDDITITQSGDRTLLGVASTGEVLAALKGVDASDLTEEGSFVVVPNVATVEDAMMIL